MKNNLLQITILAFLLLIFHLSGPEIPYVRPFTPGFPESPPFLEVDGSWADSVMEQLSLEDRIAQMIMVQAYSNMGEAHQKSVTRMWLFFRGILSHRPG
jgi:hypothetical protein